MDIYQSVWFKIGMMIDTSVLCILILVSLTFSFIQGHRSVKKQKPLCQLSHKVFNWFEWNLVYCWDLLVWWTSYSFYLIHLVFKGENSTPVILLKKNFNIGLYSDIYRPVSCKLCVMIETTKPYTHISVWLTVTFIQGHSCMRNQKVQCPFSRKFNFCLDEVQYVATACWCVQAHAKCFLHMWSCMKGLRCSWWLIM